jgi:hypothetical protein
MRYSWLGTTESREQPTVPGPDEGIEMMNPPLNRVAGYACRHCCSDLSWSKMQNVIRTIVNLSLV